MFEVDWTNERKALLDSEFMASTLVYLGKGKQGDNIKQFMENMEYKEGSEQDQMMKTMTDRVKVASGDYVTRIVKSINNILK